MRIKELAENLRPREKALLGGIDSLSDEELLALLIGKGVKGANALDIASSLLRSYSGLSPLFSSDVSSLSSFSGISKIKALELLAVGELSKRMSKEKLFLLDDISAEKIHDSYRFSLGNENKERLFLLCYDRRKSYRGEREIASGGEDSLLFSSKLILRELLRAEASSFILLHNHPSGNPLPSSGEVGDTLILKKEGERFSLRMIDHIIIAKDLYFSFRENGLLERNRA